MDSPAVIAFPRPDTDPDDAADVASIALAEIDAAIALVAGRAARRVRLVAIPFIDTVAGVGLARATAAGLAFGYEPTDRIGIATVTIGPAV
jgi:hypothetical protein